MYSLPCAFFLLHCIWSFTNGHTNPLSCNRTVDVAIVGAGRTGTYAAYKLRDWGYTVEVFEYSDRIGGRALTVTLDNVPDLKFDLGPMRFLGGIQEEVKSVAQELNLTVQVFPEGFGRPGRARFNLRGVSLTYEEVLRGNVPYDLNYEEKANQHRLFAYYLEKLTGYNDSSLLPEQFLRLKVLCCGRELYKYTFDEALDLVATPEGKEFAKALSVFTSVASGDVSCLYAFLAAIGEPGTGEILTLKEGMGALPLAMADAFTKYASTNKITLNTMLSSIGRSQDQYPPTYELRFVKTVTQDGITQALLDQETHVCARKVVLAIPNTALSALNSWPVNEPKITEILEAVTSVPLSKVYMTFPTCWWISSNVENPAYVMTTDTRFGQMYHWKQSNVSGDCAMLASYAEFNNTIYQEEINKGMHGSAPGVNMVSEDLKAKLLQHFSDVFGIPRKQIPEPKSAVAGFWRAFPYGGGVTLWRAGYNFDDMAYEILRPSSKDNVFIVGPDHSFGGETTWMVGAFRTVDAMIEKHF